MTGGRLIATGRDADVFAIGAGRALRHYRDGGDVAAEAAVMVHVAAHGFLVPAVHRAEGADLVLARVPGPTMLTALRTAGIDTSADAGAAAPPPAPDPGTRVPRYRR